MFNVDAISYFVPLIFFLYDLLEGFCSVDTATGAGIPGAAGYPAG
jgi:hypothetical protein